MLTEYPPNWKKIAFQVKARDGHRCVLCGSKKRLVAHHTREKAIPENLMTLCRACHRSFGNSYAGFKKKLRIYNDLRLDKNTSLEDKRKAHTQLIKEINEYVKKVMNIRKEIRKEKRLRFFYNFFFFVCYSI